MGPRLAATVFVAAFLTLLAQPRLAFGGTLYLKSCAAFADAGAGFTPASSGSFSLGDRCPQGGSFQISATDYPNAGDGAQWHTITPASIEIFAAYTPVNQVLVDPALKNDGYTASFFWNGGTQPIVPAGNCCGGMDYGVGINRSIPPSRYFGWQVKCGQGCVGAIKLLDVRGIELQAEDNTAPMIMPGRQPNLWNLAGRWVRGSWPLTFQATDDSGICAMQEVVGNSVFPGPTATPNQHSWTQCPGSQSMSTTVDTSTSPNGPLSLKLQASDAASPANVAAPSESVNVDNTPVSLSLHGSTDAPSSAGPQYITATAVAGPSGIAGINCSVDDAPAAWHLAATVDLAVQGVGTHHVDCYAQNNAIGADGSAARSSEESWTLTIRRPTVANVAFMSVVNRLHCMARRERVRIPAHWVTGQANGRRVHVRLPAQTRTIRVVACHPRIVKRKVWVHGRWRIRSAVELPHLARTPIQRIGYGARATASGWLGTADGIALPGRTVVVLTAPDNGAMHFRIAAFAVTRGNGSWSARLPPGPSRLVEVAYGGDGSSEPTVSAPARVIVPAKVSLGLGTRQTHWGSTITISGRLAGGYVPPAGEVVVLWIAWNGGATEIGHVYAHRDGRFSTRYTFLRGNGTETYRLWGVSAAESDYPYAPARSPKVELTVSQ